MKKIYALFVLALLLFLNVQGQVAGDFRSKATGPGNWNDFNAWERYDGLGWVAATAGQLPTATSATEIQAGHAMVINATGMVCKNLTVNGSLTYDATAVTGLTLTVSGNVTVNTGGSFTSPSSGTVVTHALNIGGSTATGVGGNLVVNGSFNMNAFSTAGVAVTFFGTPSNTISGTGPTINFYSIRVNKGSGNNLSILDITSVITCADGTSLNGNRLQAALGTIKISSASVMSPYYGSIDINGLVNGRLWLNNTGALVQSVGAGTVGGAAGIIRLAGVTQLDAGTLSLGNGSGSVSTFDRLYIAGGTLNVYGSFFTGSVLCTMTSGNLNVYPQVGTNTVAGATNIISFGSGGVTFSGGTVTIADPNANVGAGYAITGSGNLTGCTLRFGDGVSDLAGSVNGFVIGTGLTLGNVIVNNAASSIKSTRIVKQSAAITINNNLTINSGIANQYLLNGFALTIRGNIANSGTFNSTGVSGNVLVFAGAAGQQIFGGTGTFSGNINDLTINNTSAASPNVDLQFPLSVSNNLTLTRGTLGSSNSSILTIGNSGVATMLNITRSGGSLALTPTFALGGVTLNNVTYSTPVPAGSITTSVELPPSTPITTFIVNNTTGGVILDKAVSCTSLYLTAGILTATGTNSVTVTGAFVGSIVGGSTTAYVNGPLTRAVPSGATGLNFKFPVGKTAYRLIEFATITTGGTGNATFTAEAFDAGPYAGTAGTGLSSIATDKYWSLSAALGSVTITSSTIRLTDAGLTVTNRMGQSNVALGTYNSIGGTVAGGTTITSTAPVDYSAISAGTYFRIGQVTAFAAGIYAIGPQASYAGYAGTFVSMTAAVAAITAVPLPGHVIFEFQSDYSPSVETYPVALTASIVSSVSSTVTFRPAPGIIGVINISNAGSAISNAGADYVTFDGRNGGTGTNKFLQFTNTTAAGAAVTLSTDAQYNKFLYCTLKGGTTTASTGILTLSSANFIMIDNCIFDASGSANNCIYASAASDATITNNNFFDYRNGAAINLSGGSNNGIIDNNNIYQTTAYTGFAGTTYGIYVASGNNCRISNNNIGGSGPGITGTWTVSATAPAAYNFTGIYASLATTSKIYNNKIQNFDWKSNVSTWTGMSVSGTVNVGTDGANYIGNNTGTGNILITYFSTGAMQVNGIVTGGAAIIENNIIGSITTLLNTGVTAAGASFTGISSTGTGLLNNNTIGSTTIPLSINTAAQSTTGNAQNVYGIYSIGSAVNFTNNKIANINNGSSVASGITRGILLPNYAATIAITGNSIFSIATAQPVTGTGFTAASLDGINIQAGNATSITIARNEIYDLVNNAAAAVNVNGIFYNAGTSATPVKTIEKNYIHHFKTASNTAVQNGMNFNYSGAPFSVQNNVIRLGKDINGTDITSSAQITGILRASAQTCNVYFNTIVIEGTGVVAGAINTYALYISAHSTEDIRDNILVNTRSGGGKNYAVRISGTNVGLTSNYNDFFVSGTGGVLGFYNSADRATLSDWQTATGRDANSLNVDPVFTSPTNLTITNNALIAGTPITGITTDFAGSPRNGTTPTIGAYEYLLATTTAANSATITYGTASVNLTGTVTPNPGSGTVQFFINGTSVGSAAVNAGTGIATLSYTTSSLNVGTYIIRADYGGNSTYAASSSNPASNGTLTVTKADQTITFNPLPGVTISTPPFALTATASSGLPVSYSTSNPFVAFISGNIVTIFGYGTTTITASQPGNANYNPAPDVIQPLTVSRFLNLTLFLEGLYNGGGLMTAALDGNTGLPVWGPTIADHITLELHDAANYLNIIYTANDVPLNTDGTLSLAIPGSNNGNYYIAIKHRNCIETVIANPILFNTSTISYNMSDAASKAFGDNLKSMGGGVFAVYAGDISSLGGIYPSAPLQDAIIDLSDGYYIYSSYLNGDFGYLPGDINGDGIVDLVDAYISYGNYLLGIYAITP